jgi:DNA-3-methyladenine glycosylase
VSDERVWPDLLPREFFARPAVEVAPDLLGCVLERDSPEGLVAVVLTEVEAYEGENDPASHAFRGQTARNAVMYGPPGHAYVYFTYGMHFCVNLVCQPAGTASAVLLRAGQVVRGADLAAARRAASGNGGGGAGPNERGGNGGGGAGRTGGPGLATGPARLCQALGIARDLNGVDACHPGSVLRARRLVQPDRQAATHGRTAGHGPAAGPAQGASPLRVISVGPRVGVSVASERPWRFWLAGDPTVSAYRPHTPRRRKPASPAAGSDGTMLS